MAWNLVGVNIVSLVASFAIVRRAGEHIIWASYVSMASIVLGIIATALFVQEQASSEEPSLLPILLSLGVTLLHFIPLNQALEATAAPIRVIPSLS